MKTYLLGVLGVWVGASHAALQDPNLDSHAIPMDFDMQKSAPKEVGPGENGSVAIVEAEVRRGLGGLWERQSCGQGQGYCSNLGGCCPADHKCCPAGCQPPGWLCCVGSSSYHACGTNTLCCYDGCIDSGAECCLSGGYCSTGNHCYLIDYTYPTCCTDSACTARVDESGVTSTFSANQASPTAQQSQAPEATLTSESPASITVPNPFASTADPRTIESFSELSFGYWTYTVTWTYTSYFYTYVVALSASTVTYTPITTSTALSVLASGSADARSSFEDVTATMDLPTPAAATRLEASTGVTVFASGGSGVGI
ncbi:hypothetical protein EJ04DRAFT_29421 [Polyplosphaeria fusca]|uniref:Uncharacterized protein n=1 Tax=Polyplosphaeria fusca TaxID=682080 RepID=A0A9P4QT12_9PLEO|nr:hypothetical protein EJ04DRAFT_29421 [Polyplosphaeria fusca]